MSIVQGKAYWASVQSPNEKFPPPKYTVDIIVDDETAEKLRAEGMTVTMREGQGLTFKAKRNQYRKDGTLNTKPNIVDGNKDKLECLIGNGSLVNCQYNAYDWEFAGKKGRGADLVGLQVLELVPYGGDEFEAVEQVDPPVVDGNQEEYDEF